MIVVVADTSPIRYLVRIGEIDLLQKLYGQVTLPEIVLDELQAEDGLPLVRAWAGNLPAWVQVRSPAKPLAMTQLNLHRGESQAIALAEELQAALLLIDDRVGVRAALERGLTITGTLGVLVEAAQAGLIHIEAVLQKLQETNFRATPGLYQRALEMACLEPPVPPRRRSE
jgi:predicted nucleic acid-binding protein